MIWVTWARRCPECGSGRLDFDFTRTTCSWCGVEVDEGKLRLDAFAEAGVRPLTSDEMVGRVEELLEEGDE